MSEFENVNFFTDRPVQDDPYPYFDWVRDQGPVWQEPSYGMFVVTGHPEAMTVYGDPATFQPNEPASGTFSSCNVVCGSFVKLSMPFEGDDVSDIIKKCRDELPFSDQLPSFDPPNHTDHRHLFMRLITPKRLKENEDFMWQFAERLLDGFVEEGSCEMVSAYAEPFTLTVIADLEGVPESDHSLFRERLSTVHQEVAHKPLEFLYERFAEYIEDRRQNPQGRADRTGHGDVPGRLDARGEGRRADCGQPVRRRSGDDRAALSFALRMLGERPDLQRLLRDDRDRIPNFIEEMLRLESPSNAVPNGPRPHDLGGVDIPAGGSLMFVPGACNRYPRCSSTPTSSTSTGRMRASTLLSDSASTRVRERHSPAPRVESRSTGSSIARVTFPSPRTPWPGGRKALRLPPDFFPSWTRTALPRLTPVSWGASDRPFTTGGRRLPRRLQCPHDGFVWA